MSLLQSLHVRVEMKRRDKGMVVTGVEIGRNNLIRPQPTPYVDEIKGLDPFSTISFQNESEEVGLLSIDESKVALRRGKDMTT